ncbi:MAG: FmdB family transcriptional regulator [Actinomycetota bacterium]|nr:FmdB family transcriptional regulator [Actinomycetota bacterium]
MPVYQYACTACGEQLEVRQSFTDAALVDCPACEGRLRKVLSAVGVMFKGSGFYRNDSRATSAADSSDTGSSTDASGSGKGGESSSTSDGSGSRESSGSAGKGSARNGSSENGSAGKDSSGGASGEAKPVPAAAR